MGRCLSQRLHGEQFLCREIQIPEGGSTLTCYNRVHSNLLLTLGKDEAERIRGWLELRELRSAPGLVAPPGEEAISETSMWRRMRKVFTPEARQRAARAYPLRRMAEAREIANAVVFLASDAAGFITGQTLSVSGGYTMA